MLFRLLAAATIGRHFETVYRTIFGSQIAALEFLNAASQQAATAEDLRPWYKRAATENPDFYETYPFDSWIRYLANFNLITLVGNDRVEITLEGREFLKFILQMRYPFHKAG